MSRSLALRPIFIVGAPRSGTTLMRYMLCAHPGIYVPPESNFIPKVFRADPSRRISRQEVRSLLETLRQYKPFWRDWQGGRPRVEDLIGSAPHVLPAELVTALYSKYAQQWGAQRWGDKTPIYVNHIEYLATMFPTAQFIHVIRDARDAAASSLNAYKGARFFYMDPYYASRTWRDRVERGIEAGRSLDTTRYHEVRYARLTADPRGVAYQLCEFLGEPFRSSMLEPQSEASRHYHSTGIHASARKSVNTGSIRRWQEDLSARDQRLVQGVTADLLDRLGYPLQDLGRSSRSERLRKRALATKYWTVRGSRRMVELVGVSNPTRLLRKLPSSTSRPPKPGTSRPANRRVDRASAPLPRKLPT